MSAPSSTLTESELSAENLRGDLLLAVLAVVMGGLMGLFQLASDPHDQSIWRHLAGGRLLAAGEWPANDPFSYTLADQPWANATWLFDLAVYAGFRLGGAELLVIGKSLALASAAWALLSIRRPEARAFWPSVAVVASLVVASRQLQVSPDCVSMVMLAWMLNLLERHRLGRSEKSIWLLIPLFAVWANSDPRFVLGLLGLLGFVVGQFLRSDAPAVPEVHNLGDAPRPACCDPCWKRVAFVAGVALVISLASPGAWSTVRSFFGGMAGATPEAMAVAGSSSWSLYSIGSWPVPLYANNQWRECLVGLLGLAALGTFALARGRWSGGDVGLMLAIGLASATALGYLPLAGMVFAVVASLNLQGRETLPREGEAEAGRGRIMLARGGRLLMVGVTLLLMLSSMTGRLRDASGYDFGPILAPSAEADLAEMQRFLARMPSDVRGFNMLPAQGDLMAWASTEPKGRSFLDSRRRHFAGELDVATEYQRIRMALAEGVVKGWKEPLDSYKIDYVLVDIRPRAKTPTFDRLLASRDWVNVQLGGSLAAFFRATQLTPAMGTFLAAQYYDAGDQVFRVQERISPAPPEIAGPPELLRDRIWRTEEGPDPPRFSEGFNLLKAAMSPGLAPDKQLPYAILAVRRLRESLAERPRHRRSYLFLAKACQRLTHLEMQVGGLSLPREHPLRMLETLAVLEQARRALPNDPTILIDLVTWRRGANQLDPIIPCLEALEKIEAQYAPPSKDPSGPDDPRPPRPVEFDSLAIPTSELPKLIAHVKQVRERASAEGSGAKALDKAQFALSQGCPLLAAEFLASDGLVELEPQEVAGRLQFEIMLADSAAARNTLARYQARLAPQDLAWWQGWIELLDGNLGGTAQQWEPLLTQTQLQGVSQVLDSTRTLFEGQLHPLLDSMAGAFGDPLPQLDRNLQSALVLLEAGAPASARERLRARLVDLGHPQRHQLWRLAGYYWEQLSDEPLAESLRDPGARASAAGLLPIESPAEPAPEAIEPVPAPAKPDATPAKPAPMPGKTDPVPEKKTPPPPKKGPAAPVVPSGKKGS